MSLLYPGRITKLEVGLTALNNVDIINVILMNWERNHDVRPRLYANLKYPTTYQQPHSWILGSFSLLSDHHTAIYATDVDGATGGDQYAMVPMGDSNVIDYFKVTYEDEDGNARVTRFYFAIIYRHNKELLNHDDSVWVYHFLAGYAVDSEQQLSLVSGDAVVPDVLWVHEGISCAINTSCVFGGGIQIRGLTMTADGNLVMVDRGSSSMFFMNGVSCTVNTSCSLAGAMGGGWGLTVDNNGNLISSNDSSDSIYIYVGESCTLSTSFSSPNGAPNGLTVDVDGNLISADRTTQSIYFHNGITSTIVTSCSSPSTSPTGLTIDGGGNLVSLDSASDSLYIHVGLTCTISTSCSHGTNPQGLTVREE